MLARAFILLLVAAFLGCGQPPGQRELHGNDEEGGRPAELPAEFDAYREAIEASKRPYVRVTPELARGTGVIESKFRGAPFWPADEAYPVDRDGQPLVLLAQINFDEVPELEGFPRSGMVQFFIQTGMKREGHIWGMTSYRGEPWSSADYFEAMRRQDYFRVLYHPPASLGNSPQAPAVEPYTGYDIPINDEMRLTFTIDQEVVPPDDQLFATYLGMDSSAFYDQFRTVDWKTWQRFHRYLSTDAAAKIGGYGRFVQGDPRGAAPPGEEWLVLLNIASTSVGESEILWGDNGIATFLIEATDLARLDFSRVAYYWDNH